MKLFIITLIAFAVIMAAMAVGVIFKGRCIRGSCGGREIIGPDGELLNCDTCPVRKEKEERARRAKQLPANAANGK